MYLFLEKPHCISQQRWFLQSARLAFTSLELLKLATFVMLNSQNTNIFHLVAHNYRLRET